MKKNKNAEITIQAIFYILMSIVFITILIFGFQKIFDVEKSLSEQDRFEIKSYIKSSFEYCEDPLNKGNSKTFEIDTTNFNGIFMVGEDINTLPEDEINSELKLIHEGGDNVVIFQTDFYIDSEDELIFENFNIIDRFEIPTEFNEVKYYLDGDETNGDKFDGILLLDIECK